MGERLIKKYECYLIILKLATLTSNTYWFFVQENSEELTWVIFLTSIHGIIAFYDQEFVQITLFATVFIVPYILAWLIVPIFEDLCGCMFKENYANNQENDEPQVVMLDENAQVDNNQQNDDNQQNNDNIRFTAVKRTTTNQALDTIMQTWRFKFLIKEKAESCCVCLEDFKREDKVIELK